MEFNIKGLNKMFEIWFYFGLFFVVNIVYIYFEKIEICYIFRC